MDRDELLERVPRLTRVFRLIRSKDAGPFMLTIDLFCHDAAAYQRVVASGLLTPATFADLYGVPADADITGGQQYGALVERLAASTLAEQ